MLLNSIKIKMHGNGYCYWLQYEMRICLFFFYGGGAFCGLDAETVGLNS